MRTLDALVVRIFEERRRAPDRAEDLLSMLMSAKDEETREQMTDRQLRDEVMTIVAAGHETTANALSWTFYLLSKHPEITGRLVREVATVLGDRKPTLQDLPRLTFTRAVLDESMRLYPPAWMVERQALVDDEVGGFRIPRGAIVAISPYFLQRHPRYWERPEIFDPDRFTAPEAAQRPKYTYLPFGGGPRFCIGNSFAIMEAQIILAMVVRRWSLAMVPGFPVVLEPSVTLRPLHGLLMNRAPRSAASLQGHGSEGVPQVSPTP
jgi:cytochrome P450